MFLGRNRRAEGFGAAFDLFRRNLQPGDFVQQAAGGGEADLGSGRAEQAREARGQGTAFQLQSATARVEACFASRTVRVGALERDRAQGGSERLVETSLEAGGLAAGPRLDSPGQIAYSSDREHRSD